MNKPTYGSQPIKNEQTLTIQELLKHWDTHNANFKRVGFKHDNYPLKLCTLNFNSTTNEYFVFRGNTTYSISDIEIIDPIVEHHPLSPEDIKRAASKYAFENNTHRSNSKAFIAGANFAKQPHSNEVDEPIYCNCETPTLGTNLTRCGTCGEWFKRIV